MSTKGKDVGRERVELGQKGEKLAVNFLLKKGYRIVATNFRSPLGEVDLVAQDGDTTVFVEVKTRRSLEYGMPQESITSRKKAQILKTALIYLKKNNLGGGNYRFDVVSVVMDPDGKIKSLELIENAFEPDVSYG